MSGKYSWPIVFSVGLHLGLGVVLLMGNFSSHKPTPTQLQVNLQTKPQPIQAVAIDRAVLEKQAEKKRKFEEQKKAAERKRLREIEERKAAAKRKREEQARKKKLEAQRKEKEKQRRIVDEKAKQAKAKKLALEKERKRKEEERKRKEKAAADAKKKKEREEAERKRKAEAERKRKAKEKREREEQERMMAEQLAQEMAARQQMRSQQMQSEVNRFTALITQTIQRHLITDQATMEGKSCKLTITLAPSGFVTNVQSGSGSPVVCNAAKNAVYKAGTLPVSKDPDIFRQMQKISLTVIPEF